MNYQQLTIDQIKQINEISDPVARRRLGAIFQLPQDVQDVFMKENSTDTVWNITREKYNFSNMRIRATARIIGLILLGELPIRNFIVALQKDLGIDLETAKALAQDINTAIFQPIRESLMFIHDIGGSKIPKSDTNTRMHPNDTKINQIPNNIQSGGREQETVDREQWTADGMQIPSTKLQNPNNIQEPNYKTQQTPIQKPPIRYINPQANQQQAQEPYANQKPSFKNEYYEYEAQKKREEIINQHRNGQYQQSPPSNYNQPRPAMLKIRPNRNTVDLRNIPKKRYRKNNYDGFFIA